MKPVLALILAIALVACKQLPNPDSPAIEKLWPGTPPARSATLHLPSRDISVSDFETLATIVSEKPGTIDCANADSGGQDWLLELSHISPTIGKTTADANGSATDIETARLIFRLACTIHAP